MWSVSPSILTTSHTPSRHFAASLKLHTLTAPISILPTNTPSPPPPPLLNERGKIPTPHSRTLGCERGGDTGPILHASRGRRTPPFASVWAVVRVCRAVCGRTGTVRVGSEAILIPAAIPPHITPPWRGGHMGGCGVSPPVSTPLPDALGRGISPTTTPPPSPPPPPPFPPTTIWLGRRWKGRLLPTSRHPLCPVYLALLHPAALAAENHPLILPLERPGGGCWGGCDRCRLKEGHPCPWERALIAILQEPGSDPAIHPRLASVDDPLLRHLQHSGLLRKPPLQFDAHSVVWFKITLIAHCHTRHCICRRGWVRPGHMRCSDVHELSRDHNSL